MKKILIFVLAAVTTMAFSACSSGGGGGGFFIPAAQKKSSDDTTPKTGKFTKEVVYATTADAGSLFSSATNSLRRMMLYKAGDIKGSGVITGLSFKLNEDVPAPATCPNVTIKMGHTLATALSTTFANNVEQGKGTFLTVLDNAAVTVPAGVAGGYSSITLPTTFNYNGVDNLVVEVSRTASCTAEMNYTAHESDPSYQASVIGAGSTSTSGSARTLVFDTQFHFAGGDTMIDGCCGSRFAPFTGSVEDQKVQLLYGKEELNGSGPITGIAMLTYADTTSSQTYTMNVRLGHTTLSALTGTFADNFNHGAPVTVAGNEPFIIPAGVPGGTYVWMPLPDAQFTYDGTSNLIVEIQVTAASGETSPWRIDWSGISAGTRLYGAAGDAAGTVENDHYGIKFRFHGASMNVITDEAGNESRYFPFAAATGLVNLYRASELGTGGQITSVACRAAADTTAGSYPSFKMIIGHTNADTLTGPGDFVSQTTVYEAAYSIPNTLRRGDWIEIPLSTPFVYDGKSNLMVWMGTTAADGTAENRCSISTADATRYPNHIALGAPGAGSFWGPGNYKTDISLTVRK